MMVDLSRLAWGACLATALAASPALAGLSIVEQPAPVRVPAVGFEFGPWISASAPTGEAGDVFERGINLSLTGTDLRTSMLGIGMDFAYARWPSPATGASLDALLSSLGNAFGSGPVSGTKVSMTSWEVGGHVKVSPLPERLVAPWARVGLGLARVNRKIEFPVDQLRAAGWQVNEGSSDEITYEPYFATGVGLDIPAGKGMKIGLDASYQWLVLTRENNPFTAFRFGAHVLFGHW
jgi:hypothetical protein